MKEYNKITAIVCSRKQMEENKVFLENVQSTCEFNLHVIYIVNNGVPLTHVYKEYMEKTDTDIVVFMHDDIEFLRKGWGRDLVKSFQENEEYGIIGIAGSASFSEQGAWWNEEIKYGQVLHRNQGQSWLTKYSPLYDGIKEVCCVDGLFFAVEKTRIGTSFDENILNFHFYEIDLCLSNFTQKQCKIGVITSIRVAHNSIGEINDKWYENKSLVVEKYKEFLPIKVE